MVMSARFSSASNDCPGPFRSRRIIGHVVDELRVQHSYDAHYQPDQMAWRARQARVLDARIPYICMRSMKEAKTHNK